MCTELCGPVDPVLYFASRWIVTYDQAKFHKTAVGSHYIQVGVILSPAKEAFQRLKELAIKVAGTVLKTLCSHYSKGCEAVCLRTSGQLVFSTSKNARFLRSMLYLNHLAVFMEYVARDLRKLRKRAHKAGKILVTRTDTLSDTDPKIWEGLMNSPECELDGWVDYTKNPVKYQAYLDGKLHPHHHLTFSRSETNGAQARWFVANGGTATVVVRTQGALDQYLAEGFDGFPCVDGTLSDRRWEDPRGNYILLLALGAAKRDSSGFVVD